MQRTFTIAAIWDDEAKVFYSKSDIKGLHIEAGTIEEFEGVMSDLAIEMIVDNHISVEDLAKKSMRDLVPAILWRRPENDLVDCTT